MLSKQIKWGEKEEGEKDKTSQLWRTHELIV